MKIKKTKQNTGLITDEIVISPTEPTGADRKKVWLQKGKNLFDYKSATYLNAYINTQANNITVSDETRGHYFSYIQCQPNTTYTISKTLGSSFRVATFTTKPKIGVIYNSTEANHTDTSITITTGENDHFIGFVCFSIYDGDIGTYQEMYSTVQIEQNTEATSYEEYINHVIYVKNNNDIYEEFTKKENDTGWITLEIADNFKPYVDAEINKPRYRKIGNIVQIQGELSPINEIETPQVKQFTMFSLPNSLIPNKEMVYIMQGSDMNRWNLRINVNGTVTCSRYGTTTAINIPANVWLPFNVTYFLD